jgi:isopenicillin N synthase-like dioxygenase
MQQCPNSIPIISLSDTELSVIEQIKHTNETIGFFAIVDHGVPIPLIRDLWEECFQFWHRMPQSLLASNVTESSFIWLDYTPIIDASSSASRATLSSSSPSSWILGPTAGRRGMPWAPDTQCMRTLWTQYYEAMEKLLHRLMRLFALALELPENHFEDKLDCHCSPMRTVYYPPMQSKDNNANTTTTSGCEANQCDESLCDERAGEHTDWGCVTILLPDPHVRGLLVKMPDGAWVAPPESQEPFGAFVINLGDLMPRWTQDKWKATPHKVTAGPGERARGRMTIPFFGLVNATTRLEAILSCCEEGVEVKYEPILAGQFFADHEKYSVYNK